MTRRDCVLRVVSAFSAAELLGAASPLTPVDQAGFRELVTSHKGRILLVDFWATWCAPCREEMPKLVSLAGRYAKQVDLLTISCDEPEAAVKAAAFVDQNHALSPRFIRQAKDDDAFINSIDPKWSGALPALFVFDRNGRQAQSFIGETNMGQLEAAIKRLLNA